MKIKGLLKLILDYVKNYDKENNFQEATEEIKYEIDSLKLENFLPLITEVGIIPEKIEYDSKEEKLFTKVSEIVLARCFYEIGLKSTLYTTRSNTADVLAESIFHNYSLVADAKAFKLSRTAKNQKDFKVESLNDKQAMDYDVSLFSWEYFSFLINKRRLKYK